MSLIARSLSPAFVGYASALLLALAFSPAGDAQSPEAPSAAAVEPPRLSCGDSLRALAVEAGETRVVSCPRRCTRQPVWGTSPYSADSSVCAAAVHAGVVSSSSGGLVEVRASGAVQSFEGSEQNGVRSQAWGPWPLSFTLAAASVQPNTAASAQTRAQRASTDRYRPVECAKQVRDISGEEDDEILLLCPQNCATGSVYGVDHYFDGSSACRAAIHAGVITMEDGGLVYIKIGGARQRFAGSERNGVTSRTWGPWTRSFTVLPFEP